MANQLIPFHSQFQDFVPVVGHTTQFGFDPPKAAAPPSSPASAAPLRLLESTRAKMTATSPARSGVSPSSSPRLPSPPPFTEVQIGPKSPNVGDADQENQLGDAARLQEGARRRIRPGTKAADMATGPPLVPLVQVRNTVAAEYLLPSTCSPD